MTLNDPEHVREEYASEARLLGRRAAYQWAEGPDAPELQFQTIAALERQFAAVEERDLAGSVRFPDRDAVAAYLQSVRPLRGAGARLGEVEWPFVVRRHPTIFVATKS